jgi:hypothetical protein
LCVLSFSAGVTALTDAISGNGALTSLDISDNMLCGLYFDGSGTYNGAGVAALSYLLKVNSVLKELNMSKNYISPEGAKVMSLGLSGNGALSALNLSENCLQADGAQIICEGVLDAARCVTSLLFDWLLNIILCFPKLHQSMPAAVC